MSELKVGNRVRTKLKATVHEPGEVVLVKGCRVAVVWQNGYLNAHEMDELVLVPPPLAEVRDGRLIVGDYIVLVTGHVYSISSNKAREAAAVINAEHERRLAEARDAK